MPLEMCYLLLTLKNIRKRVVIELGVPDHFENDLLPNPTLYLLSI